jgi:hypothetical protein
MGRRRNVSGTAPNQQALSRKGAACRSPNPPRTLLCSVEHEDRRDIVDKASAGLVTRRHDLRWPVASERLSVVFIGDDDLIAAEARVDLSRGED